MKEQLSSTQSSSARKIVDVWSATKNELMMNESWRRNINCGFSKLSRYRDDRRHAIRLVIQTERCAIFRRFRRGHWNRVGNQSKRTSKVSSLGWWYASPYKKVGDCNRILGNLSIQYKGIFIGYRWGHTPWLSAHPSSVARTPCNKITTRFWKVYEKTKWWAHSKTKFERFIELIKRISYMQHWV